MKTRKEIEQLWIDQDACPDFEPVLNEVLDELDRLRARLGEAEKIIEKSGRLPIVGSIESNRYLKKWGLK